MRRGTAPNRGMFAQRLTKANLIPSTQTRRRNLEIKVAANPKLEVANALKIRGPSPWSRRRASPGHGYPELLDVPVLNAFAHKPRRERTSMNSCVHRSSGSPHHPVAVFPHSRGVARSFFSVAMRVHRENQNRRPEHMGLMPGHTGRNTTRSVSSAVWNRGAQPHIDDR
jgi:hypothetical protein